MSGTQLEIKATVQDKNIGRGLWVMIGLGVVIVLFFGFAMDLYPPWLPLKHWQSWELGAVIWSLFFAGYYYFTFPFTSRSNVDKSMALLLSVGVFIPCGIALFALYFHWFWPHVISVTAIGFVYLIADAVLAHKHQENQHKKVFRESIFIADLPIVAASIVLLVYLLSHRHARHGEIFFSGAISFQLLISNIMFVLSQGGFIRKIWQDQNADGDSQ